MLLVMSVKPTLTDEQFKVNSALKVIFSANSRATSDSIKFYAVLELFEATYGLLQKFYRL